MRRAALVIAALTLAVGVEAADPLRPHPHRGILAPFAAPPPSPALSDEERRAVEKGDVGRSDGRRMVVFTVDAPPEQV